MNYRGQDYIILLIWAWNKSDRRLQLGTQIEVVETWKNKKAFCVQRTKRLFFLEWLHWARGAGVWICCLLLLYLFLWLCSLVMTHNLLWLSHQKGARLSNLEGRRAMKFEANEISHKRLCLGKGSVVLSFLLILYGSFPAADGFLRNSWMQWLKKYHYFKLAVTMTVPCSAVSYLNNIFPLLQVLVGGVPELRSFFFQHFRVTLTHLLNCSLWLLYWH